MGMNVNAYRAPKKRHWIDYDVKRISYWADEHLLHLLKEIGIKPEDQTMDEAGIPENQRNNYDHVWYPADLAFNKQQWVQLISICEKVFHREVEGNPLYAQQYTNESDQEFLERWKFIIETFKAFRDVLDWEQEHVLIYTSY